MTPKLKAPFPWLGGKSRASELVWKHLGADYPNYVEPFAGSVACLLSRPGSDIGLETINDKDAYLINAWLRVAGRSRRRGAVRGLPGP